MNAVSTTGRARMVPGDLVDAAIAPLDLARRKALLLLTRSRVLTQVLARRRSRVAAMATVQVCILFALSVLAPVGMFFVGPLTLGVPHLAADARYLILRRTLPRAFVLLSASSAVIIVGARSAELLGLGFGGADALETAAGGLWMLSALAFAVRDRRTALRALALLPVVGAALTLAVRHPGTGNIAMMHVHNVIGIVAWLVLFPRRKAWEILPVAAVVAALGIVASGSAAVWTHLASGDHALGATLAMVGKYLAPGFSAPAAASIVIAFVFLQAVHYAVWLAWIPQEDLAGEGTPTFRMTVRGLRKDFGIAGCLLVGAAMLGLAVLSVFRIGAALNWYLTLSRFHGLLELAVIAFLFVRGQDLSARPSTALLQARGEGGAHA
jgi:hypothetical protein